MTEVNDIHSKLSEEQLSKIQTNFKEKVKKDAEEMSEQFSRTLDNVITKIDETGWTLPIEMAIYPINVLGQTSEIKDINQFFYWYFTENERYNFVGLVDGILSSTIDEKFKTAIKECVFSYENKKYIITSITLITVIEGILSSFYPDKTNVRMMKVCQIQVDKIEGNKSVIEKYVWLSYNNFVRKLYEKSDFNNTEPSSINRHWLLHGRSEYNLTEIDCLRLFNAVSSICSIVNKEV
ncbi:hypothetical protein [Lentibacillus cibarius]|uniref:DUF4209 domain-containing protein n=1 Tax=Lentibacillus cibarius TaxID=2583219 RepID=A0A5S3QIV1_9BACI|nr:hypothetical protein [Lentibacillus cibarius]TMN21852.1 hypothetical protein FFL34_06790 [Lentibacillus cibarius]